MNTMSPIGQVISHNLKIFIVSVGTGHRAEEGVKMAAVEYRAIIRFFLFMTGRMLNKTFDKRNLWRECSII